MLLEESQERVGGQREARWEERTGSRSARAPDARVEHVHALRVLDAWRARARRGVVERVVLVGGVHGVPALEDLGALRAPEVCGSGGERSVLDASAAEEARRGDARETAPEMLSMLPSIQPLGRLRWIVPR